MTRTPSLFDPPPDRLPVPAGPWLLVHAVRDDGDWSGPQAAEVARRWPGAEAAYRDWYRGTAWDGSAFGFAQAQRVLVGPGEWVANVVCRRAADGGATHVLDLAVGLFRCAGWARRAGAVLLLPRPDGVWGEDGDREGLAYYTAWAGEQYGIMPTVIG